MVGIAQSVYSEQRESTTNTDSKYFASLSKNEIAALKKRENQNPKLLGINSGEDDLLVMITAVLTAVLAVVGVLALTGEDVGKDKVF
jgi:hypothetical protein